MPVTKKRYTVYLDDKHGGFQWRMDMDGSAPVFGARNDIHCRKATLILEDLPAKKTKRKKCKNSVAH